MLTGELYAQALRAHGVQVQLRKDTGPTEDVDAIAVSTPFARDNSLRTIADLGELSSVTLGARPEFEDREQGFTGMQSVYSLTNAVFTPMDLDATYDALFDGDVDEKFPADVAEGFLREKNLLN